MPALVLEDFARPAAAPDPASQPTVLTEADRMAAYETGYQAGQHVTPFYDALLAKIIAYGETREMAIGRLLVALRAFEVSGVTTNAKLLMKVLEDQDFLQGRVDTSIVPRILGN